MKSFQLCEVAKNIQKSLFTCNCIHQERLDTLEIDVWKPQKKKYTDTYIYIYNTPCHTWIVRQNMLRDLFHIHFQYFRHLAPFSTSEEPCKEQCSPCKYPRAKETAKQLLELRCEGVLDFTEILFLYLLMGSFYLSCVCVCVSFFLLYAFTVR